MEMVINRDGNSDKLIHKSWLCSGRINQRRSRAEHTAGRQINTTTSKSGDAWISGGVLGNKEHIDVIITHIHVMYKDYSYRKNRLILNEILNSQSRFSQQWSWENKWSRRITLFSLIKNGTIWRFTGLHYPHYPPFQWQNMNILSSVHFSFFVMFRWFEQRKRNLWFIAKGRAT